MARRALLTDSEREAISNPDSRENPYVAVSRVRKKINEELSTDVEVLREHHPDLFDELREVVCGDTAQNAGGRRSRGHDPKGTRAENTTSPPAETHDRRDAAKETLRQLGLPGSGSKYETRIDAVLSFYDYLREHEGDRVTKGELKEFADESDIDPGYTSFDSLWSNWVKGNSDQGRPKNTLTYLPGVEMDGDDYIYTGEK